MDQPDLIRQFTEIVKEKSNQSWIGAQTGIETTSVNLMEKHMRGKVAPFKVKDWPEVVINSFGVLNDNCWLPAATLIIELPGECADDINDTLCLLDDLYQFQSIIVPLFFVPINLINSTKIKEIDPKQIPQGHWEIINKCLKHDSYWMPEIFNKGFKNQNMFVRSNVKVFMNLAFWSINKKISKYKNVF